MTNQEGWEQREKQFLENPRKTMWKGIRWVVGVFLILSAGGWLLNLAMTPAQTAKDVIQKTLNADNVIQNYEWFKQQNQDYIAITQKMLDADTAVSRYVKDAGPRSGWTFEDKTEYSRVSMIALGLRQQRADIATKYNARTQMYNREIFKTNDLPHELTP